MVVLAARALVNCALLPSVAVRTGVLRACTDGGALAGPFWDAFTEEAKAEAEELGLTVRHLGFNGQKLAVHADGAARVVHAVLLHLLVRKVRDERRHRSDNDGHARRDAVARRRDGHQRRQD